MTDHIEDRLAVLVAQATPGPWALRGWIIEGQPCVLQRYAKGHPITEATSTRDAEAIVSLVNAAPALLAVVRAARRLELRASVATAAKVELRAALDALDAGGKEPTP